MINKKILTGIWIYPVKSLGGIQLSSARVMSKGLAYDRRWMLISEDNVFMTQRDHPLMALFKLSYDSDRFIIRHDGHSIELSFQHESKPEMARVWNDTVLVHEVSRRHSEWFSDRLNVACRLVAFPEDNKRPVDPRYAFHDEQVSLADGYPLLVIGQRSLDDLNNRLKTPLPMNRFRPNIVFDGGEPYEEDNWRRFRVGTVSFARVKPCARCVITTVDQATGIKSSEPLATLASYRRVENKVYFGQNLIPLSFGEITTGDEIVVE